MRKTLLAITATSITATAAIGQSVTEQSVQGAKAICIMMDNSALLTQPCEYSIWGSSITAVMAVSVDEARQVCDLITQGVEANGVVFEKGWKLNIRHPFSGENNIATCPLD